MISNLSCSFQVRNSLFFLQFLFRYQIKILLNSNLQFFSFSIQIISESQLKFILIPISHSARFPFPFFSYRFSKFLLFFFFFWFIFSVLVFQFPLLSISIFQVPLTFPASQCLRVSSSAENFPLHISPTLLSIPMPDFHPWYLAFTKAFSLASRPLPTTVRRLRSRS